MPMKRYKSEQIAAVLKQAKMGIPVAELIHQMGFTALAIVSRSLASILTASRF